MAFPLEQSERRGVDRDDTDFMAAMTVAGKRLPVRVHNVSVAGFMAEGSGSLLHGDRVEIDLPVVGKKPARLIWRIDDKAGFSFFHPVNLDECDSFLATCRAAPEARDL